MQLAKPPDDSWPSWWGFGLYFVSGSDLSVGRGCTRSEHEARRQNRNEMGGPPASRAGGIMPQVILRFFDNLSLL